MEFDGHFYRLAHFTRSGSSMRQLLAIIMLFLSLPAMAADDIVGELQQRASEAGLHRSSQWLALLHYRIEALGSGFVSQADDPAFFVSADGGHDPAAEMRAAIRAFLQASAPGHAQCRFPARWRWLRTRLDIDVQYAVPCPKFERWRETISDDSLTLVFPAMYLNNPGSAFGHTFLRFDHHSSVLLSHALNYAALYDPEDDILSYSIKGILGGYGGVFSLRRYFQTVQAYSDIENRDIWEYRLDYERDEIDLLLRHVWELLQIDFRYYFFTENCSYRLLALLDVMRDDSSLAARQHFPVYATPVDTVRVIDEAGIIIARQFRPSLGTRIEASIAASDDETIEQALALTHDGTATSDANAPALDIAIDVLEFRGKAASAHAERLLLARSRLSRQRQQQTYQQLPPERGHASARMGFAVGEIAGQSNIGLELRPVFHDLLDDDAGFVQGAQINILSLKLIATEDESVELERLLLVDMRSLPAWRRWYRPLSWTLDAGFQRVSSAAYGTRDEITTLAVSAGVGASFNLSSSSRLFSLLVADVDVHNDLIDDYSLQLGVRLGWLMQLAAHSGKLLLELESLRDVAGQPAENLSAQMSWQVDVAARTALRASYRSADFGRLDEQQWSLTVLRYF